MKKSIVIKPDSFPELLLRDWENFCLTEKKREIGPYQNPLPSMFERGVCEKVQEEITKTAKMGVENYETWNALRVHSHIEYHEYIINFAIRWARLMQKEILTRSKKRKENLHQSP